MSHRIIFAAVGVLGATTNGYPAMLNTEMYGPALPQSFAEHPGNTTYPCTTTDNTPILEINTTTQNFTNVSSSKRKDVVTFENLGILSKMGILGGVLVLIEYAAKVFEEIPGRPKLNVETALRRSLRERAEQKRDQWPDETVVSHNHLRR